MRCFCHLLTLETPGLPQQSSLRMPAWQAVSMAHRHRVSGVMCQS